MVSDKPSVDSIFLAAVELPPDQRPAFLDGACGEDAALRARVERLLAAESQGASFLESPAPELGATADRPVAEHPGAQIGPYTLLEQIGEGGFGVVFLAEQEKPVRRRVALKVVKPGMDTREVIARFEAERQALAMMDHPNIAKVFDAGATETGRPYFVMELVQGVPVTEYCDQCQLTTRERLELFVTVCQAVQHAHQKGIIHRDLKPNNVLVAMQDGQAAPKIIDFGVAKAIGEQTLTEQTLTTAFAQMIGTPMYMSPEQAELSPLGVDTRSDIYSLGVMLYELLAGATPFDKDRLHAASYDELRRIIREEEPPRPSARISTLAADLATTVSERRRTDARRLQQTVHGELDWIVMKCLEKDRNRRYETPNSLARDIERYLHDEPVQACPPSVAYRLKKFIRRNKIAAAFVLMLVASVAGLAISNIAIKRERDAKGKALADAKVVANVLYNMLASSSSPDQIKGPQYTVRELLDEFSAGLGNRLANQPEDEATIRSVIGKSYWRLGENETAEPHLKRALYLRRQMFGGDDERVADSLLDCALNLVELDRLDEAESCVQDAVSIYKTQIPEPRVTSALAEAFYQLAVMQLRSGDRAGYRASCTALAELPLSEFGDVSNMARPIWTPCLAPHALDDMSLPVKRAEEFVANNSFDQPHFRLFMLGAALYRAGKYEQASQRLEDSIARYPSPALHGFDTLNYQRLFLAMTRWQLGQRKAAHRLLDETKEAIELELASPLTEWVRRTTFELLGGEAEALIGQKEADEDPKYDNPTSAVPLNSEP